MIRSDRSATLAAFLMIAVMLGSSPALAITMEEAVQNALRNNSGLMTYTYQELASVAALEKARSAYYPYAALGYGYSYSSEDVYGTDNDASSISATVSYNLFSGYMDRFTIEGAMHSSEAASYNKASAQADLALEAKKAYIEVLRARKAVEVAREAVKLLERQEYEARLYYEEGLIARNDLLRVQVELSGARQDLIEAAGGYRVALATLESLMGTTIDEEAGFEDFSSPPTETQWDFAAMETLMYERRSELLYLNETINSARAMVRVADSSKWPSVDLSLSLNGYGDSVVPMGRGYSYEDDVQVKLSASWVLYDGSYRRHGIREAEYEVLGLEEQMKETRRQMRLQLRQAYEGHMTAEASLAASETAVTQAEENYRVTENRFHESEATTVDMLDAGLYLTQARNRYFGALYDMHEAQATIERVTGAN